jgi:hypothetical protein
VVKDRCEPNPNPRCEPNPNPDPNPNPTQGASRATSCTCCR